MIFDEFPANAMRKLPCHFFAAIGLMIGLSWDALAFTTMPVPHLAPVQPGTNIIPIIAQDYGGHAKTNRYQIVVPGGETKTLEYDANGNLIVERRASNVERSYEWDAANRLVKITQNSVNPVKESVFSYDGLGRRVQIIEKENNVEVSNKRFVWIGAEIAEERDSSGANVVKRFYAQGVSCLQPSAFSLYFTRDHLGSIREVTDSTGAIRARYDYSPYGIRSKVSGDLDCDFGFTGHYYHQASGLNLTHFRVYNADLGRWLSKDPIGEDGGLNLYAYVANNPVNYVDPFGLCRNKGESFKDCLERKAKEFYGDSLDYVDMLGFYGLASSAVGLATGAVTSGIEYAAGESIKNAPLAGVHAGGSMPERMAAGRAASKAAGRLAAEKAALAGLSKASGILGAAATGFSYGARGAFIGDCMEECPCKK